MQILLGPEYNHSGVSTHTAHYGCTVAANLILVLSREFPSCDMSVRHDMICFPLIVAKVLSWAEIVWIAVRMIDLQLLR